MTVQQIIEGTRAIHKNKVGTVVAIGFHGMCYWDSDTNKKGNDGMQLVAVADLTIISPVTDEEHWEIQEMLDAEFDKIEFA